LVREHAENKFDNLNGRMKEEVGTLRKQLSEQEAQAIKE